MLPDLEHANPAELVPPAVGDALRRCAADYYRALNLPLDTYTDQAARAAELAEVCQLRARCWAEVTRWAFAESSALPWVLGSAVLSAHARELDAAGFWRDTARYWRGVAASCEIHDDDISTGRRWAS
jgi:hypothetical protein